MDAAANGDSSAIEELLARHLPSLEVFLRKRTPAYMNQEESIADLSQSICREVLGDLDTFEYQGEGSFRAWLFTVAEHKIVSRLRYYTAQKRDRNREVGRDDDSKGPGAAALDPSPSQVAMGKEWLEAFQVSLRKLPEEYRQVLTLSRLFGLPRKDVASQMGRSEVAIRALLFRATRKLEDLIREQGLQ